MTTSRASSTQAKASFASLLQLNGKFLERSLSSTKRSLDVHLKRSRKHSRHSKPTHGSIGSSSPDFPNLEQSSWPPIARMASRRCTRLHIYPSWKARGLHTIACSPISEPFMRRSPGSMQSIFPTLRYLSQQHVQIIKYIFSRSLHSIQIPASSLF